MAGCAWNYWRSGEIDSRRWRGLLSLYKILVEIERYWAPLSNVVRRMSMSDFESIPSGGDEADDGWSPSMPFCRRGLA